MKTTKTRREVIQAVEDNLDYLVRFAFFRVGNRQDAEDIVHSAIERLLTRDTIMTKTGTARMYLFRTVNNACLDFLRKQRPTQPADGLDFADTSDEDADLREEARRINPLLDRLPGRESEVIRMRVVDELQFVEIADILSIPATTAKSRFKSGMDRLRTLYNRQP